MQPPVHIINKVFLEVNTRNKEKAYFIKNNIDAFLKHNLFPQLELLLNINETPEIIYRIEKLNLNFNLNLKNWNKLEEIQPQIEKQFEQALKQTIENKTITTESNFYSKKTQKISPEKNAETTVLFFFKNGFLPWYGKKNQIVQITTQQEWLKHLENRSFQQELKTVFLESETAIQRFIIQFSHENVILYFIYILQLTPKNQQFIRRFIQKNTQKTTELFFEFLIRISVSHHPGFWFTEISNLIKIAENQKVASDSFPNENLYELKEFIYDLFPEQKSFFQEIIHAIENNSGIEKKDIKEFSHEKITNKKHTILGTKIEAKTQVDQTKSKISEEHFFEKKNKEIHLINAGLILLHPFLERFFSELKWLDSRKKIKKEYHETAIQTLHYLATYEEDFFEGNLMFAKFLGGVSLKNPIPKKNLLNKTIKKESEQLLIAVIKNWSALKNTTVPGLQNMFFKRDGKLIETENNYKLIVERKTQDILLDKLPWNLSLVKIPWINKLLVVEW